MGKKLAIFLDGTWDQQLNQTNVFTLWNWTKEQQKQQLKYYHSGVGVTFGQRFRGGAFGYGLDQIIKEGYYWLCQNYEPEDEIYLFGFSRGAYTARSLAGLIRKSGIPHTQDECLIEQAYTIYREKQWRPSDNEANTFRETFSWPNVKIKFIGVWDTVGMLGLPTVTIHGWIHGVFNRKYYEWHDTELSQIVEHAYHALALDEHRPDFPATVWSKMKRPLPTQTIEQRWFPGCHADIGGGYPNGKLQNLSLLWMQNKAKECGLQFTQDAIIGKQDYLAPMHDSLKEFMWGIYTKFPGVYRIHRPLGLGVNERVDESAYQRMRSPEGRNECGAPYSPPALRYLQSHAISSLP